MAGYPRTLMVTFLPVTRRCDPGTDGGIVLKNAAGAAAVGDASQAPTKASANAGWRHFGRHDRTELLELYSVML